MYPLISFFKYNNKTDFNPVYLFVFVAFVSDNPSWACCFTAGDLKNLID